ncbi:MAG TPA: BON domain-containing protein [Acidobacteriaceae bacterium]|nr:BON domain-containing protein [Acidobacteriaceae bacterium]
MKKALLFLLAAALSAPAVFAQNDSDAQAAAQKALSSSRYKGIQVSVQNGIATLSGNVDVFASKMSADQKVRHVKGVTAVRDEIQVNGGSEMSDQQLQEKLQKAINYDMVGYGTTAFDAIGVQVHNGVAVLSGHAYGPVDASDAVAIVENTKGVRDVVNNIDVDPVSPMDDQIRLAVYRKVYGFPMLNKYAIDPVKPIRIQVANGHVTLYGTVDTEAEKNAAGIQANSVSGVFSVTNDIVVANATKEKPGK